MSIFDDARAKISPSLIESFFYTPGAYWENGEYWTLSPLRSDRKVGSFSISEDGLYWDFVDDAGGDFFDLVAGTDGCSKKEAAEEIIRRAGGVVPEQKAPPKTDKKKKDKPEPVIPIPPEAARALNKMVKSDWSVEHYGTGTAGWKYRTKDGGWAFSVTRFDGQGGQKNVIPYYYGSDNKWYQGNPYKDHRPLYRLDELVKSKLPVLLVEGEKCASVEVPGYFVTTWSQGSSGVSKTDWSPLTKRKVVVWPDADAPGTKARLAITARLPQACFIDVSDHTDGWDIADAADEGLDPAEYIAEHLREPETADECDGWPFQPLGFSESHHFFLLQDEKIPFSVQRGSWRSGVFIELAPLAWWANQNLTTDSGNVRAAQAQDLLMGQSKKKGRFYPDMLRGAGVWRDDDGEIIVNDGLKLVKTDGTSISLKEYKSRSSYYLSSDARFGELAGNISAPSDGEFLVKLFEAQGFAQPIMAALCLGWALIAPFGGALSWRPHLWITGPSGAGKSWIVNNLMKPLSGPFAYEGSGKDSEPGVRRSLRTDARPAYLEEMGSDTRGKVSMEQIYAKLELARNASSEGSGYITIAKQGAGGVDQFKIRSMFCCISVNVPDSGRAIRNRFTQCELRRSSDTVKRQKSREYLSACGDLSKYRRRVFRKLPGILDDIEYLNDQLPGILGGMREADQYAPLLAAVWAVRSDESIQSAAGQEWLEWKLNEIDQIATEQTEDEDRVIEHILSAQVRTDEANTRTVGELLELAAQIYAEDKVYKAQDVLSRAGIRFLDFLGTRVLAFATRSDQINGWLRGTPYEGSYDAQLRRNSTCLNKEETGHQVRFSIGRRRARLFEWSVFQDVYLKENEEMM